MTVRAALTLTAYPASGPPYERWEITTATGEVIIKGDTFPVDTYGNEISEACRAYWQREFWENPDE